MFGFMPVINTTKQRPWLPERLPFDKNPVIGQDSIDVSFYNSSRWRKLRKRYITQNPLCEVCQRDGVISNADVVDHIKPSRLFDELKESLENLQSLCTRHHNIKSQIESFIKKREQFDRIVSGRGAKLFVTKS